MSGLEYRPTVWVNIYNRIRLLDFSDQPECQLRRRTNTSIKTSIQSDKLITDKFNSDCEMEEDAVSSDSILDFSDLKSLQRDITTQTQNMIERVNSRMSEDLDSLNEPYKKLQNFVRHKETQGLFSMPLNEYYQE